MVSAASRPVKPFLTPAPAPRYHGERLARSRGPRGPTALRLSTHGDPITHHTSPIAKPTGRALLGILLLLAPSGLIGAADAARIEHRLDYALRVWKGLRFIGRTVGSATVEIGTGACEGHPCRLLRVRTRARFLRFRVNATTHSYVDPRDGHQLAFHYLRTGSKRVESRLLFKPSGIEYHKWLPVGKPPKEAWEPLAGHPYDPKTCDMFAVFYAVQPKGLEVGGEGKTVRCVADRKLWDVTIRAVARERITVPAGAFDTLRLEIEPSPANDLTRTIAFRGPFALGPDMRLWVDPETGFLIKLAGTAHLTLPVSSEMRLLRISEPQAEKER